METFCLFTSEEKGNAELKQGEKINEGDILRNMNGNRNSIQKRLWKRESYFFWKLERGKEILDKQI
jgi:hypothetical protein